MLLGAVFDLYLWLSWLQGMLLGALQYRQAKAHVYQSDTDVAVETEYIPWTSSGSARGIRTMLFKQVTN
jgi:hypothetical protein